MDMASHSDNLPVAPPDEGKKRSTPWFLLAFWFVWLAALIVMSFPYWGKSKRDLIETKEEPVRRVEVKK